MAMAELEMQFEKIKSMVNDSVRRNPSLFASIDKLGVLGLRPVEITICTEKQVKDGEFQSVVDTYITPTIVDLRNRLIGEGYNVSDIDEFVIDMISNNRPYVSFRCSLVSFKKEIVENPNDIGMPSMQRGEDGSITWA
jgi:3-methyladenine DNA glycosylase AlkD